MSDRLKALTRTDVIRIIAEARAKGLTPDLSWANLSGANLSGADLSGANLSWANLSWANLSGVAGVFGLGWTPSGWTDLRPLPNGTWQITVGCFKGSTDELRAVIAGDDWPSECDEGERNRRRPILMGLADYADALAAYHPHLLDAVVQKWGDQ